MVAASPPAAPVGRLRQAEGLVPSRAGSGLAPPQHAALSVRGVSAARRLTLGREWGFAPAGTSSGARQGVTCKAKPRGSGDTGRGTGTAAFWVRATSEDPSDHSARGVHGRDPNGFPTELGGEEPTRHDAGALSPVRGGCPRCLHCPRASWGGSAHPPAPGCDGGSGVPGTQKHQGCCKGGKVLIPATSAPTQLHVRWLHTGSGGFLQHAVGGGAGQVPSPPFAPVSPLPTLTLHQATPHRHGGKRSRHLCLPCPGPALLPAAQARTEVHPRRCGPCPDVTPAPGS